MTKTSGTGRQVRIGIGGWTFEPWRDNFFPKDLKQKDELSFASRHVTAIEINGTYYRTQTAASFAKWHDETPDDFVFSAKASRYSTNRKVLGEAGESIERFLDSGLAELGPKLGPLLWQFMPTKKFDPDDFEAFLKLLPAKLGSLKLRHVMDVRHDSFKVPEFVALARKYKVAAVFTDSPEFPSFADITADFVYARLMNARSDVATGYEPAELDEWAKRVETWSKGGEPADLPRVDGAKKPPAALAKPRDVFVFAINGAKERAPAAAMALIERMKA
jgi:uncharacterized protein YecE (DUF72 family)